jgi:Domain of unknown function (DUF4442)
MRDTTPTYRLWKTLARRPGGSRVFSAAAMLRVPYFASIVPHVVTMEPGFAEVTVVLRLACGGFTTVAAAPKGKGAQASAAASA